MIDEIKHDLRQMEIFGLRKWACYSLLPFIIGLELVSLILFKQE
jgi:hypothetical protein|tara:strand:+ start:3830 stop:3961 length:132 start_codon:yes stop_codon:yes gene_type:complete